MSNQIKKRGTFQVGKIANGVNISKHIDRSFDYKKAKNINDEKAKENAVYVREGNKFLRIEQGKNLLQKKELEYYKNNFQAKVDDQVDKYLSNRQKARAENCTIENYYNAKNTGLTRIILQVGAGDDYQDKNNLAQMMNAMIKKVQERSLSNDARVNCVSVGFHFDEKAYHIHLALSFEIKDEKGNWCVNQEKCLERLGYEKPRETNFEGRYNNRKQAWTAKSREKWFQSIEEVDKNITIERTPSSKNKMTKGKVQQAIYELNELIPMINDLKTQFSDLKMMVNSLSQDDFEKKRKSILDALEKKEKVFGEKMKRFEDMLPKVFDDDEKNTLSKVFGDDEEEDDYDR